MRGNRAAYGDRFSFADLTAELPFENLTALVHVPGAVFAEAVRSSRARVAAGGAKGYAFYLHVDDLCDVDPATHAVTRIGGEPFDGAREYVVALGFDLGLGSGNNEALTAWAEANARLVPHRDAAIPAKTLLVEFFAQFLWRRLPSFDALDADGSGALSYDEVHAAYTAAFADVDGDGEISDVERLAAGEMSHALINAFDTNGDHQIDRDEYEAIVADRRFDREMYNAVFARKSTRRLG